MRTALLGAAIVLAGAQLAACARQGSAQSGALSEARKGFTTRLLRKERDGQPAPTPPAGILRLVHYPSPAGSLAAYISPAPTDGKKHPAIIWVFGGFDNGVGDTAWVPATPDNDQSARAFRQAGVLMMYPSLRGGNDNPGYKEGFYGEVDDVLAAARFLAGQKGVDPKRIYLGGHSTGGTLALLAAECSDQFRAVFAFGPVADVRAYGAENLPFDLNDPKEVAVRAPYRWMAAMKEPTFVIEGTEEPGNIDSLRLLARVNKNPLVHFVEVPEATHFSSLAKVTPVIARRILADTGPTCDITLEP